MLRNATRDEPPVLFASSPFDVLTPDEVENMRGKGNLWCSRVWLGTYDAAANPMDYKDDEKIKDFMIRSTSGRDTTSNLTSEARCPAPLLRNPACPPPHPRRTNLSSLIGTTLKAHSGAGSNERRRYPPCPGPPLVPPALPSGDAGPLQPKVQHPAPPPVTAAPSPATTSLGRFRGSSQI